MASVARLTGKRVHLDSNIFIYAIEGVEPFASVSRALFEAADSGLFGAVTSELTLAEALIVPIRRSDEVAIANYLELLSSSDHLDVVPVTRTILVRAAEIRAAHGLRTPDAIQVATALESRCDAFLTNDDRLRALPVEVIRLSDVM